MTRFDISDVLRNWPYDPARNVRRISTAEGTEKLQVRLPLGIEQYELDGRPDGVRPDGRESYLEFFEERIAKKGEQTGLSETDCSKLHEEGALYYFRYYLCFQIGDFDRVIRDTSRNLRMFDFVDAHADREEDKVRVDQRRPYVLRMMASAKALKLSGDDRFESAIEALNDALEQIEEMAETPTETFRLEKTRSLSILRGMVDETRKKRPPSEREQLERRLKSAVAAENYERAARLRDLLTNMGNQSE